MVVRYMCDRDGCEVSHCWRCAGYSSAPPDELCYPGSDVSIHMYFFCKPHLEATESCTRSYQQYQENAVKGVLTFRNGAPGLMSLADFVQHVQATEAKEMVVIFSAPARQFSIVPVAADGWCIFASVAKALDEDFDSFVRSLAEYAETYVEQMRDSFVDPSHYLALWEKLDTSDNDSVQELWSCDDGDVLLLSLVAHFLNSRQRGGGRPSIQIVVWKVSLATGALERSRHRKFPQGDGFQRQIHLLQSNPIVPHYDLLAAL